VADRRGRAGLTAPRGFEVLARSALWQVNAVRVRVDGRDVLVDSPVLPAELRALARAGGVDALAATHAHFDHVLAPAAFPGLPLHVGPATRALLERAPGQPLDDLRESDEELYVERDAVPSFADPARDLADLADLGFAVLDAPGHAEDGSALRADTVLLPGDYLIAVEIPLVSAAGSAAAYAATLERLEPVVRAVDWVVPGHGPELTREQALALLEADHAYVGDLRAGPRRGPHSARQRRIHEDNVRKHAGERDDGA
jgi:glyoxylase-like metal-dependent hydrolase (beta-lactamase superfamily II)